MPPAWSAATDEHREHFGYVETWPVHTFKGWPDLNRHVRKASKAKAIYVPIFRKQKKDNGDEEHRLSGFKLVTCMFAVSDTEGDDLPEYGEHRGIVEFEAEGSAYLIMNELGATDQFGADESRH